MNDVDPVSLAIFAAKAESIHNNAVLLVQLCRKLDDAAKDGDHERQQDTLSELFNVAGSTSHAARKVAELATDELHHAARV